MNYISCMSCISCIVTSGPAKGLTGPLINTPLQRGGWAVRCRRNRFSGLLASVRMCGGRETAKAVAGFPNLATTPLKRGVNERIALDLEVQ
jgi:hypothetical protein